MEEQVIARRILWIIFIVMITPSKTAIGHREETETETDKPTQPRGNKLLLILLDGMRHDALDKNLKGFNMMKENGVYTKAGLKPCFPSVSFTNYYCITTGLYAESHGMVGNNIYDKASNTTFQIGCYPKCTENDRPFWWNEATPIWVDASAQGKRVRMVHWPGCEVVWDKFKPTEETCHKYTVGITEHDLQPDVDSILTQLADDKLDFAAIYQEEPDHTQHWSGVWSKNATRVVETLATAIEHLQEKAKSLTIYDGNTRLEEVLDIIIVSDHGHTNISGDNFVDVRSPIIQQDDVVFSMNSDGLFHVWPKEGKMEKIYETLSKLDHVKTYKRESIPDHWHFTHNDRIADIVAVVDRGYYFIDDQRPNRTNVISTHGYDNNMPDMSGIFMARGPHFKKNFQVSSMDNIEVYQIMCAILGINARPNNGTWKTVNEFMLDVIKPKPPPVSFRSVVITVIVALVAVILITVFICSCYYFKQQSRTKQYRTLPTNLENELDADELDL